MDHQKIITCQSPPSPRVNPDDVYLNNFQVSPFVSETGQKYLSVEHYFQSEKYQGYPDEGEVKRKEVIQAPNADLCKKLARKYQNADKAEGRSSEHWQQWEERKVNAMKKGIELKFDQNSEMLERLLATGDAILIEDSDVDMYWGGALEGSLNMLGKLLMEFRESQRQ